MGLFSSSSKQNSTTSVTDISTPVNVGGDANAPVLSLAQSSGNTVNLTDSGAIAAAFDFAGANSDSQADLARRALEQSYDFAGNAATIGNEQARQATERALSFVGQATKPDEEKQRDTFNYLVYAVLAAAVAVAYILGAKK